MFSQSSEYAYKITYRVQDLLDFSEVILRFFITPFYAIDFFLCPSKTIRKSLVQWHEMVESLGITRKLW